MVTSRGLTILSAPMLGIIKACHPENLIAVSIRLFSQRDGFVIAAETGRRNFGPESIVDELFPGKRCLRILGLSSQRSNKHLGGPRSARRNTESLGNNVHGNDGTLNLEFGATDIFGDVDDLIDQGFVIVANFRQELPSSTCIVVRSGVAGIVTGAKIWMRICQYCPDIGNTIVARCDVNEENCYAVLM